MDGGTLYFLMTFETLLSLFELQSSTVLYNDERGDGESLLDGGSSRQRHRGTD
jgi:hypothetical protein